MKEIRWGIIGCGDVTELKSGPAFNKVPRSSLVAVMRRDGSKAKDYAARHGVPAWYDDAQQLIDDPAVNAIYIATPPSSHEAYAVTALRAGKPVYVEKPMTVSHASAITIAQAAADTQVKLSVAHYRRGQPYFNKIKELLEEKAIGEVVFASMIFQRQLLSGEELKLPGNQWRTDPAISGGGLFHDLAPHQLDIMYYFFGTVAHAAGVSVNQTGRYPAEDVVAGNMVFNNGIVFNGIWRFNASSQEECDKCEITGSEGTIGFSVFGEQKIWVRKQGTEEIIAFAPPRHVQQPMIEKVVAYFLGEGPNPCSARDGAVVMQVIDAFTKKV